MSPALLRAMPLVFVLIWSTGFVVARMAMPHAPPLAFLCLRYGLSMLSLGLWVTLAKVGWPRERAQWRHLAVSGALMHGGYLGGVWAAVKGGIGAGTIALVVGLQPVLTALWLDWSAGRTAHAAGHRVTARQWAGLLLGLGGVTLVLWRKLGVGEITPWNLALAAVALGSITIGTLYQKRFVSGTDVRCANAIQLLAALVVTLPFTALEHEAIDWQPQLVGALAWSVLVLTLGGSSLLFMLLQRGAASRVTSLMYLVPPTTAAMAWLLFDEAFTLPMLGGMLLTVLGVALVVRAPAAA